MARIIVDVMPKAELLDPQGQAVHAALGRLGVQAQSVRQGKRFEIVVEEQVTQERLAEFEHIAETLLSNPVIEEYALRVE